MYEKKINTKRTRQDAERYSRRDLVAGAGKAATFGAVAAALGACAADEAPAEENLIGSRCMTILYPNGEDVTFDFDYYKNKHLTLIMDLYGSSIRKFELRRGLSAPDGSRPTYVATITIWIADLEAFAKSGEQHSQTLIDDVPNFTDVMPLVQADEIVDIAVS